MTKRLPDRHFFDTCFGGALIRELNLLRPIYQKTAAYGHFGRNDPDFAWEKTNKADALKAGAKKVFAVANGASGGSKAGKGGKKRPSTAAADA